MKRVLILLVLILVVSLMPVSAQTTTFYDLGNYGWALSSICRLADRGIIKGTAPHYYSPQNPVKRGEVCTLLCRIYEIDGVDNGAFADVSGEDYYYSSISALKMLGIIKADAQGNFLPDEPATRETTMRIAGFLLLRFGFFENPDVSVLERFPDAHEIAPENREYVAVLVENGFIQGDARGMLCPGDSLTRAEIAVILDRIYSFITGV